MLLQTCIEVRMADTSYVGDQRAARMSRQIAPSAYTFGWNILLTNLKRVSMSPLP